MRRRLLGMIGIGTAAILMLSGFDSAMTCEDLQKNAVEAMKTVEQYSGTFDAGADISATLTQAGENGAQMTLPIEGEMQGSFSMTKEPLAAGIEMQFSGAAAGQQAAGSMQLYMMEQEDGTGVSYMRTVMDDSDSGWQAGAVPAEDMEQMKAALDQVMSGDIEGFLNQNTTEDSDLNAEQILALAEKIKATLDGATTLSPEPADVNGREAYEAVVDINGEVLTQLISDAAQVAGEVLDEATLSMVEMIANTIDIKVVSDFDTETFLPLAGSVDLTGSDFAALSQFILSMMGSDDVGAVDLAVNRLGAEYTVSYDDFGGVVIPEEALAVEPEDVSSALGSVVDDVTGAVGLGTEEPSDNNLTEGLMVNEDGSYHLEDENYEGEKIAVDITLPEGMKCQYGSESYMGISDEDYRSSVNYSLNVYYDADEALANLLNTDYMESDEDYSDIEVSDPAEITLEDGTTVKYRSVSYKYQDYQMGKTYAVIPVGNKCVELDIELEDESYNQLPVTEDDIVFYAGTVKVVE